MYTQDEIMKCFAEIDAQEPEELTQYELKSLAYAEKTDDGTTQTLDDFKKDLEKIQMI